MKPFAQVNRTRFGANGSVGKKEGLRAGNDLVWVPAKVDTERSKLERAACVFFISWPSNISSCLPFSSERPGYRRARRG